MGEIEDAIERADREGFTRQPPKTLKGQIGYLLKQLGSAKAVAAELGVTADSVNRYRRGARKHARPDVASKTVETRARFGYESSAGSTDDGRFRRLTVKLPPTYAQRLFDARDSGASDQEMRGIIAEGFKEVYFQDNGGRAMGLSDVAINDIDYLDLEF
ncbi:telomere-protecting terminal protein Tpg [Streptomyces sp. NPDC059982]|uniref:telomere-protecting terminal protein Tpg n=1 Tax=unclassified Streptomyces TaxID=2593676 RepID=UPI00367C1D14